MQVHVTTKFLPHRSEPQAMQYLFVYRLRITNVGTQVVQLMSRSWNFAEPTKPENKTSGTICRVRFVCPLRACLALDGLRRVVAQSLAGDGVVGHKPVLRPGQCFEYHSGVALSGPKGTMEGSFKFEAGPDDIVVPVGPVPLHGWDDR